MPRIIVLDTIAQEGLDLLNAESRVQYDVRTGLKGDELREALAEYDGAIVRSGVKITAESLAGNHRLKAIVRAGVGTDNIDITINELDALFNIDLEKREDKVEKTSLTLIRIQKARQSAVRNP